MKRHGFVTMLLVVAVGLLGLAPVAVCEMPPDCPMQQPSGHHVCCAPAAPADGMAAAPCHPVHPSAAPVSRVTTVHGTAALPLSVAAVLDAPAAVVIGPSPAATPVAAVPRFLLTHTFRL